MNSSKFNWSSLNPLQLGKCAEYLVRMEFLLSGFHVYSSEVDDHGVDLAVCRKDSDKYYDIQVRSVRNLNYIFFPKDKFALHTNLFMAVVLFFDGESPQFYLIPSVAWLKPNKLLASRDYPGRKSKAEWGLNLSQKNLPLLLPFAFDKVVQELGCTP